MLQPASGVEEKAAEEEAGDEEAAAQPEGEVSSEDGKTSTSGPASEDGVMKVGRGWQTVAWLFPRFAALQMRLTKVAHPAFLHTTSAVHLFHCYFHRRSS